MKQEGWARISSFAGKNVFKAARLAGLYAPASWQNCLRERHPPRSQILGANKQPPPDCSTHWSTRKLARHLGVSHSRVARVWTRAGIQPHRLRRYMASTDPEFEEKAADATLAQSSSRFWKLSSLASPNSNRSSSAIT